MINIIDSLQAWLETECLVQQVPSATITKISQEICCRKSSLKDSEVLALFQKVAADFKTGIDPGLIDLIYHDIKATRQIYEEQGILVKPKIIDIAKSRNIQVKPNGQALCPFHADGDPSLHFYAKTNTFFCFGCQAHGDVISFVMQLDKCSFPEACKTLGIKLPDKPKQTIEEESLPTHSAQHILEHPFPPIEWYVQDILPKGGICFFGGTSGSFKSWNALSLGISLTTGKHYLNEFAVQKCKVLYIDEENGKVTMPNRLKMLTDGMELQPPDVADLHFSIFNNIRLDSVELLPAFNQLMDELKPNVVVIDSMVRCMTGEENNAKDVKEIYNSLKPHMKDGVSFVILHHTVKNDIKTMAGLRGSGDFSAFADCVVMFSPGQKGFFFCNIVKNRHIEMTSACNFFGQLHESGTGMKLEFRGQQDDKGNVNDRCQCDILAWIQAKNLLNFEAQNVQKMALNYGHTKNRVFAALENLIQQGQISKLRRGVYKVINQQLLTEKEDVV